MFKDVLWSPSVQNAFDVHGERQKYNDKICELVHSRISKINQILLTLRKNQEKAFFLSCIDISSFISIIEARYEKNEFLKHFLALSFLLSSLKELPTSLEKLVILWKMLIDYQEFQDKAKDYKMKFLISEMSRISLDQPTSSIKISIIDRTPTEGNLMNNINNLLGVNSLVQKLDKKMIQINSGRKYSFQDKKIFTPFLNNFGKVFALSNKLSYALIVVSTCELLSLIYTMLTEEIFYSKEAFEVIEQIDGIVYAGFLKYVFEDLQLIAVEGTKKEFDILETCLEASLANSSQVIPKLDSFLN